MAVSSAIIPIYFLISKKIFPIVTFKTIHMTIKNSKVLQIPARGFVQLSFYAGSAP